MSRFSDGDRRCQASTVIPMRLVSTAGWVPVDAELHYSTGDPFAVRAVFRRPLHSPVSWVFARDLLVEGRVGHAGDGDVQVIADGDDVIFCLSSPEGSARLVASSDDIDRFVTQMLDVVAPGREAEHFDVDAELAALDPAMFAGGEG